MTEETIVTTTTEKVLKDSKGKIIKDEKLPPIVDKKDVKLVESILAPENVGISHMSIDESNWKPDNTEGGEGPK